MIIFSHYIVFYLNLSLWASLCAPLYRTLHNDAFIGGLWCSCSRRSEWHKNTVTLFSGVSIKYLPLCKQFIFLQSYSSSDNLRVVVKYIPKGKGCRPSQIKYRWKAAVMNADVWVGTLFSAWGTVQSQTSVAVTAGGLSGAAGLSSLMVVLFPVESKNSLNSLMGWRIRNGLKKSFPNSSVKRGVHRTFLACHESWWFSLSIQMVE